MTSSAVVGSSAISSCGLAGERHRDHHALAHAARHLVRILVDALARAPGCRTVAASRRRARARRAAAMPLVQHDRLDDLLADGEDRVERGHRLLEDHRDLLAADACASRAAPSVEQIASLEHDAAADDPARRLASRPQDRQRGDALAAARFADDAERLARARPRRRRRRTARTTPASPKKASAGSRRGAAARSYRPPSRAGIERVAQPVAEEVEGHHREEDRDARHVQQPRGTR